MNLIKFFIRLSKQIRSPQEAVAMLLIAAGLIAVAYFLPNDIGEADYL